MGSWFPQAPWSSPLSPLARRSTIPWQFFFWLSRCWFAGCRGSFFVRLPRLPQASLVPSQGSEPSLSVLIPARSQGLSLPRLRGCPEAAEPLAPGGPVVDDHSRDGTAAIAQAAGAPPWTRARLSAGWTGKTWALRKQASSGDPLLAGLAGRCRRPGWAGLIGIKA